MLTTVASADGQLRIETDQLRVTQLAGTKRQLGLVLQNNRAAPLSVEVAIKGVPNTWVSVFPTVVGFASIQAANVTLTFAPPADAPSGDYPLHFLVQVVGHPETVARLNLILEIAEPGKLAVSIVPAQAEGQVSAEFRIQLEQAGASALPITLSATDDEGACDYSFEPTNLVVPGNGSAISQLTVHARQGLAGLDSRPFVFTVNAIATEGAAALGSGQGRFVQRRSSQLEAQLVPTEQRGSGSLDYALQISNPSGIETVVRLSASELNGGLGFQFQPTSLTVPAAGQAQATVTATPLISSTPRGENILTFSVRVVPSGELLHPVEVQGRFIQTNSFQPLLTLAPTSQDSRSDTGIFEARLKNPHPQPLQVELRAFDTTGACEIILSPPRIIVPPNGTATARLTVHPITKLLQGESRRSYPFSIQAQTLDTSELSTVNGFFTRVSGPPLALFWIAGGVLALILLAVFFVLLYQNVIARVPFPLPSPTIVAIVPTPTATVVPPTPSLTLASPTVKATGTAIFTATNEPPRTISVTPLPTFTPFHTDTATPTHTATWTHTPTPPNTATPTAIPTDTPTFVPTATFTRLPTRTRTPVPPTPTPTIPPGLYVTKMHINPATPRKGQPLTFTTTFQNTTGGDRNLNWCVEVWKLDDNKKSFGISACNRQAIPAGLHDLDSGVYFVSGVSACLPLRAQAVVVSQEDTNLRLPITQTDNSAFWYSFQVCP